LEASGLTGPERRAAEAITADVSLGPIVARPCQLARDLVAAAPGLDVAAQVARAGAWLRANPERRKSRGDQFLLSWLTREQDRNGGRANGSAATSQPSPDYHRPWIPPPPRSTDGA
jgi:hypothetical protein